MGHNTAWIIQEDLRKAVLTRNPFLVPYNAVQYSRELSRRFQRVCDGMASILPVSKLDLTHAICDSFRDNFMAKWILIDSTNTLCMNRPGPHMHTGSRFLRINTTYSLIRSCRSFYRLFRKFGRTLTCGSPTLLELPAHVSARHVDNTFVLSPTLTVAEPFGTARDTFESASETLGIII